jgi:hypothetical protein
MTSAPIIQPPDTGTQPAAHSACWVILQLRIPHSALTPPDNHAGTLATHHLINARLELAGVKSASSGAIGEFNASIYVARVWLVSAALEVIAQTIEPWLPFATIGWYDPRESVIRTTHPTKGGTQLLPEAEIAERQDFTAFLERFLQNPEDPALRALMFPAAAHSATRQTSAPLAPLRFPFRRNFFATAWRILTSRLFTGGTP